MAQPLAAAYLAGLSFALARGYRHGFHRHDACEVVHHPQGAGVSRTAAGDELAFAAGDTCLYPPFLGHDRRVTTAGASWVLRLELRGTLPSALRRAQLVRGPLPPWLVAELRDLAGPQPAASPLEQQARDHRATAVLLALLARLAGAAAEARDPDRALADQAAAWITAHAGGLGRLEEAAAALGQPYDRLRRVFRRQRGESLLAHLTRVRVTRAQELLAGTGLPHAEIARQCGWGSARYLNQCFRRVTGATPGSFRRRA